MIILVCCIAFYRCYFLRQPYRKVPNDENLFVSPANWEIIAIIKDPTDNTVIYKDNNAVLDHFIDWIGSGATMVSIMMTPMNVHYQRSPNNATLIEEKYVRWKRRNDMKKDPTMKSTLQNEYNAIVSAARKAYDESKIDTQTISYKAGKDIQNNLNGQWFVFVSAKGKKFDFSLSTVASGDYLTFSLGNTLFQVCRLRE